MFGFIASPCARCTSTDFPFWRGTFCGLARVLARDYSAPARLLVNRDATFLALLGLSIDPEPPNWRNATCCNPLATPFSVDDTHPAVTHAAAVTVCGLATKLDDDSQDERGLRRIFSKSGSALISPTVGHAVARLNTSSFPTASVLNRLADQERSEIDSPLNADEATARSFGIITAHLAELLDLRSLKPNLERLGASHGRLVYWQDAWDDRKSDRKKGRFNPYFHVEESVIRERVRISWDEFTSTLASLPAQRHSKLLSHIGENTGHRHAEFLGFGSSTKKKRPPKNRERPEGFCRRSCDYCDCCHCGDCGSGSSGSSDCCPCDGCDCCPCD